MRKWRNHFKSKQGETVVRSDTSAWKAERAISLIQKPSDVEHKKPIHGGKCKECKDRKSEICKQHRLGPK